MIRYVLGKFGRPTTPVDANVKDRILSRPRAKELAAEPPPLPPEELRKRFKPGISDDEFLLRAVMPAEEVDAMLAAGPTRRHYNPDMQPILKLLRELQKHPRLLISSSKSRTFDWSSQFAGIARRPVPRAAAKAVAPAHSAAVLERLRGSRAFVFDMDGTLVLGDKTNHGLNPLPGRA